MKVTPFNTFQKETAQRKDIASRYDTVANRKIQNDNAALKGIILNNHIKRCQQDDFSNFDEISSSLLIPENIKTKEKEEKEEKSPSFNAKKALKPLLIASGIGLGAILLLSSSAKLYSNHLAKSYEPVPGDLPRSMNLLEEQDLAIFRALRNPSCKNILGFIGVMVMSAVTLIAKSLVDGIKDVWIKKQECDINHDFQENLIAVETEAFSGKLNVVNTLLADTTKYFKEVLSSNNKPLNFQNFISFKGDKKDDNKDEKDNKLKKGLTVIGGVLGFIALAYLMFRNYQKTIGNLDKFEQRMTHNEIANKIQEAVDKKDIDGLKNILKLINASQDTMRKNLSKVTDDTSLIDKIVNEIEKSEIYAQAPEALAGVSEKIQYYCYINEPRGHLYNWILNPENKFNKYLFLSLSATSALGYVSQTAADAIKSVAVTKENSNSELNLRKKLVSTEIENFKSKKLSAINPMIDNFNYQLKKGKSKQELKEMAENILIEIKNGPPYVYS